MLARECSSARQGLCFKTMLFVWRFHAHGIVRSIWPPHAFVHSTSRIEKSGGVAMTSVSLHPPTSIGLDREVGVDQAGSRGCVSTRRHHPGGRSVSSWNHRELVGARGGAVVEIRSAAGLEGSALALGGAGVRRRKVCVVVSTAEGHAAGDGGGCVREGGRVVHSGTGKSALGEWGESRELTLKLARKRTQICRTYRNKGWGYFW